MNITAMSQLCGNAWKRLRAAIPRKKNRTLVITTTLLILGSGFYAKREVLIFLPGTQPGTVNSADNVLVCRNCHYSTSPTRPVAIYSDWSGSMMAHSARDPVFFAALAAANKYNGATGNATGEYCIRCHSPTGWLAGHSEDFTGLSLAGSDFDGVQCDYCHRAVDPLNPDSSVPYLSFPVPGYGNGMHVAQRLTTPKRGPYDSVSATHGTMFDSFQKTSEFCGVCHDVSNVYYAQDRILQAPHEYGPLERTYSEWLMSWYATQGDSGTCQSCHMPDSTGFACVFISAPLRNNIAKHDLTGGNTFVPDILPDFYPGLDTLVLAAGKRRAAATLQRAADLTVEAYHSGDSVIANVRITNSTGHKLPTGYPDGRRMWINIFARNPQGDTVFQSGAYDPDSASLINDSQIKVYEAVHGLTSTRASAYALPAGPSLHFSLNDTIFFDNRIPPRGYTRFGFQQRLAQPVAASYADSQYWDVTTYRLPSSATEVTVTLFYQTISRTYVEFLRDENVGNTFDWNQWGNKLYTAWELRGKSQPVAMNSQHVVVQDSATSVGDEKSIPSAFQLLQNYPNPFNPTTTVTFVIGSASGGSLVTLRFYDALGAEVATLVDRWLAPGTHTVEFDGGGLPSGIYFYSLAVGHNRQTRKMLLIR